MTDETAEKIHSAAQALKKAIEDTVGHTNVFIGWTCTTDKIVSSGITLGDDMDSDDIARSLFFLTGRAYNNINYD